MYACLLMLQCETVFGCLLGVVLCCAVLRCAVCCVLCAVRVYFLGHGGGLLRRRLSGKPWNREAEREGATGSYCTATVTQYAQFPSFAYLDSLSLGRRLV